MEKWQDPETLALWFGIIILFVLSLVVSIILLVRLNYRKIILKNETDAQLKIEHQRELLETSISIQEKERHRIANDLHDGLIGKLTAIRLKIQMNLKRVEIDNMLDETINEARRITHDLSPPLLEFTSFEEILKERTSPWLSLFDITYKIDIRTNYDLSVRTKIQMTRILEELMTNIVKHSNATKILFHIRQSKMGFAFYISDNGKGLDQKTLVRGLGLKSIESRVQYIKGKYKVKSSPNKSTSFLFLIKNDKKDRN